MEQAARVHRKKKTVQGIGFALIALAVLSFLCAVVCLITAAVKEWQTSTERLLIILGVCTVGGAALFACVTVVLYRVVQRLDITEKDLLERARSEDGFFVGEGTLATFFENKLVIDGVNRKGERQEISVPYSEIRFFSVCERQKPCEKGRWSVVLEIPLKYLAKDGAKGDLKNGSTALIQTDGKPRLYECLEKYGIPLLGEPPLPRDAQTSAKKFTLIKKYGVPDRGIRKKYAIFCSLGAALVVVGVVLRLATEITPALCTVMYVFGAYIFGKYLFDFIRAKSYMALCREGIYLKTEQRIKDIFLKWSVIEHIRCESEEGVPALKADCGYGSYRFPAPEGIADGIEEIVPHKIET